MALHTLPFLVNVEDETLKGRLVAFNAAGRYGGGQTLIRHSVQGVALRAVRPGIGRTWDDVDLEAARAASGVRLGLGEFDKAPTSGFWPLAFNGDSTGMTALASDIAAADLQTLLTANPAIVTAGGVSGVVKNGRSYRVTFTTVGAKAAFTSASNTLLPLSSVTVEKARVGDWSTKEIVVITVKRRPYALCDSWTASAAADATVETAIVGDTSPATNCVQVITLTAGVYGGTYSLAIELPDVVTGPGSGATTANIVLAATDTADQVLDKLSQHPEAVNDDDTVNLAVTGEAGGPFTVEFIEELKQRPITEMVATNINLLAPETVTGALNLNQDGIAEAFDAAGETATTITLTAELELEFPGQEPCVVYQDSWTIRKNVLDGAGSLPAPSTSYAAPGLLVQFRRDITSFALLGAVVTATGGVQCLVVNIAGAARIWELVAGTDATDTAGGIKRPDDYDAGTNAYVWKAML